MTLVIATWQNTSIDVAVLGWDWAMVSGLLLFLSVGKH